jgi:hypothetical protein
MASSGDRGGRRIGAGATIVTDQEFEMHVLCISRSKLKSSMGTSTLLAGFALVAMVEAEVGKGAPPALLIPFAMINALLICVHLLSIVVAARLLPELDAIMAQPHLITFAGHLYKGWPVQFCWFLSNMIGTILFLVELILVAYVKFYSPLSDAKIHSGTGTLAVVVVLLAVSAPLLIIFSYSISKKKMWMHEQRLAGARNILAAIPRDMSLGGNNLSYSSLTNSRSHFHSRDSRSVDIADETIV